MAKKQLIKFLDDLSQSEFKLRNLPRKPAGLYNMAFNEYGQLIKRAGHTAYNTDVLGTSTTLTGTVEINKSSTAVAGTNTLFDSELAVGDLIKIVAEIFSVSVITNDTNLIISSAYQGVNVTGVTTYQLHKILGMQRFYKQNTSSKEFIVAWNNKLYGIADTDPWGKTALESETSTDYTFTADSDTFFADFANHCYIVNGVDDLQKYNGTYVRSVGITPPAAAPTGTSPTDTGYLSTGDYKVCYTYVDEDGYESNASAGVTIAATANDIITLAIVVSTDDKVTKRRIYRTIADGAIFYYDKEVDNNTAITVDLTQADSTLSLKTVLHTDHNSPPDAPSLVVKRRSRLNVAVDDSLYVSKNYDKTTGVRSVEYFPPTLYFPTGNGQKITGLLEQLTNLPVFTDDSIERLWGTDEENFEFKNSYATEGCIATRSLVNCENLLVYLEFDGIHYFDGVSTGIFSKALNKYIKANIVDAYAHLSCGAYYDDKYLLCYPKTGGTYPTETVYYDFVTKTYGVYSFAFSCFSRWDKGTDGLQLYGGSNTIGQIYKVFDGLDDDGSDITAYNESEPLDFGKPEVYKNYYSVLVRVKTTTGTAFTFYYKLDNDSGWSSATKTLTANTTKWYRIGLGSGGKRGRTLTPKLYMSNKFGWEIHGFAVCYDEESFAEEKE